jgi:hypothetical protein
MSAPLSALAALRKLVPTLERTFSTESANSGLMHRSKRMPGNPNWTHAAAARVQLFDYLVGECAQFIRYSQSECLGSLHVDHQLELDRSLDRKLARLFAFEDAAGIGRRAPALIDKIRTVGDQAAAFSE